MLKNLAESREEIGAEIRKLRHELRPKVVMHNMVDHHKGTIVGIAIGAVVVTSALIVRQSRGRRKKRSYIPSRESKQTSPPGIMSYMLRLCAGTLVPILLKSTITDRVLESLIRPRRSSQRAGDVSGTHTGRSS